MAKPLLERQTSNQRRGEEYHESIEQLRRGREDITRTATDRGLRLRSIDLEENEAYPFGASKGIRPGRVRAVRTDSLHFTLFLIRPIPD
ncbi:unnamed protein product, partial [Musa textilis]